MKKFNLKELANFNDRVVSEFPAEHPARRYIEYFYRVRAEICSWPDRPRIDLDWNSDVLGRKFSFADFAYIFISREVFCEGWFLPENQSVPTLIEISSIEEIPFKRAILRECKAQAEADGNSGYIRTRA